MTEAAHPALTARAKTARWARSKPRPEQPSVSFPELVHVHRLWRKALEAQSPHLEQAEDRYRRALAAFEAEHGPIVNEYWCWQVPSAVALTSKPAPRFLRLVVGPKLAFHRVSDWATKDKPDIAAQLHRCDELAVRSTQVLSGLRQRISLELVMASAGHLLSLVDSKAAHERADKVLAQEKRNLDQAEAYYRDAANGQAQIVYFAGMALLAVALCVLALLGVLWLPLADVDDREFYGCFAAGALGAVLSVIQRINSGRFDLEYDVGSRYVLFLGGLRPAIGAVFGLGLYFAVTSDILNVFALPGSGTARLYALLVIAFVAGFSERWAQDTLTSVAQEPAPKSQPPGRRPVPPEK